ncbi:MAG: histone deacetylase family protein [Rhodobacteraceae bacterium]|jgi:acetoin utilization deacetylase AcuC-like enzyme|nr:histone deacetylase family protein [Paracoccaceae bacterium]
MTTALYTHPDFLGHVTPPGHPERVDRLHALLRALEDPAFAALARRDVRLATDADLLLAHPAAYVDRVRAAIPAAGWVSLDADTHVGPGSLEAALRAVGGAVAAVDAVLQGHVANAFVACRPPGHHAERDTAMGFCLFGTVAIAALHALERRSLSRVAIVDFDVHHGNGTQDILWNERRALFASTHQMPLYPGTGDAHEVGAHGNILNVPLAPATGGDAMRSAYETMILPAIADFEPDLVLVSAGFDAHAADPLANLNWREADYVWLTHRLCDLADDACGGRLVSCLEGGYDLDALAASAAAHVAVLMERGA